MGSPFDPEVHEAIMREPNDDVPDGTVLEEFRKGFRLGETLLRPAMVKVGGWPEGGWGWGRGKGQGQTHAYHLEVPRKLRGETTVKDLTPVEQAMPVLTRGASQALLQVSFSDQPSATTSESSEGESSE